MITRIFPRLSRSLATAPLVEKTKKKDDDPIMIMPRSAEGKDKFRKRVILTLLGAHNQLGHITATCLKLKCKDLKEIRMWDTEGSLRGVALELSHLPTSTRVLPFIGKGQLQMAIRNSDIVMIMGGNTGFPHEPAHDLFCRNNQYIREMATAIISNAPKALIGVCVNPIMPSLAYFSMLQRMHGVFCPNKVFGVMSLDEMRARTLAAVKLGLPPGTIKVQLTGGATNDTVVPVMSAAQPGGEFLKPDLIELMNLLRSMTDVVKETSQKGPYLSGGHATATFVMKLAKGLCSEETASMSAAVMNTSLFGVPFLTLPVTVGHNGVIGTTGIPRLSNMEMKALIRALPTIMEHITMGESLATQKEAISDELLHLYQ